MLHSRVPAPLMVRGGLDAAATQTSVAQSAYASLAETTVSAAVPNAYVDPLLVGGGVIAGVSVLAVLIYIFVSSLMGGPSNAAKSGAAASARPSAAAAPDAAPLAGFLGRDAGAIFSGGLSNLGDQPVGWLFGDRSPLYSNTAPPTAAAPARRVVSKEVSRQSGAGPFAVTPRPAAAQASMAPSAKPFGGRFEAPVATSAAASVAQVTVTPVAPATAPAATVVIARPVAAAPAASVAPAVGPSVAAVPVVVATPVARAVTTSPPAAPPPVAVANPVPAAPPLAATAASAAAAPSAEPTLAILAARVSELTERNNQLVEMMTDLQRQLNEVKAGK